MLTLAWLMAASAMADQGPGPLAAWTSEALTIQRQLDVDAPLRNVQWFYTHNSYNSGAYSRGLTYIDPNQLLSIPEQLQLGVRALEFDVHWTWDVPQVFGVTKHLKLCHGTNWNLICSPFDRDLEAGLAEIRDFLRSPAHAEDVILLYLEDFMAGHHAEAIAAIEATIGPDVYRPTLTSDREQPCQGIPMTLTKRAIRAAGKRLLIMGGHAVCGDPGPWQHYAFAGVGTYVADSFPTASLADFRDGDCYRAFDEGFARHHWTRVLEDRTKLSEALGRGVALSVQDVSLLGRCGVNLIGLDQLEVEDPRLPSLIWSFAIGEPAAAGLGRDCVALVAGGHLASRPCDEIKPVACRAAAPRDDVLSIAPTASRFARAREQCAAPATSSELGRFSLPINGREAARLAELAASAGASEIWVNLRRDRDQRWLIGY